MSEEKHKTREPIEGVEVREIAIVLAGYELLITEKSAVNVFRSVDLKPVANITCGCADGDCHVRIQTDTPGTVTVSCVAAPNCKKGCGMFIEPTGSETD